MVEILRDLGCSPELLSRLQERLDVTPPSAPPLVPGSQAKRLADLQASLAKAQSHHLVLMEQHDATELKLAKAKQALSDNSDRIVTLTAEVAAAKAEISPPASVNHMDSGDEDNHSFQSKASEPDHATQARLFLRSLSEEVSWRMCRHLFQCLCFAGSRSYPWWEMTGNSVAADG